MSSVLIIDNYDSFTYNLVQYLGELGADVDVVKNDEVSAQDIDGDVYSHIVVSPGPCTPNESGVSMDVISRFAGKKPVLGVCLGHQCIAALYGATIGRAKEIVHGKTSQISHDGKGIFEGVPALFSATRYHSLVIEEETLSNDFDVSARDKDGQIMAIRHRVWNLSQNKLAGVQFHPESIMTPNGKALLKNFLT